MNMNNFHNYKSGRIHYSDLGRGEVLVLIHGYLETSEIWGSFARRLEGKFRIISVDLPGHGRSDNFGELYTMDFMAEAISDLLGSLGIDKSFIIGHSLGGYITLAFAELFPEMLTGYCLFHSQPFADDPSKIEKRNEEICLVEEGKKELFIPGNISKLYSTLNLQKFSEALLRSKEIALKVPGETIIAVLKGMITRPSRVSVMESGEVPYLWILGAFDNLISCEAIQSKVHLPKNAQMVVLENSGHMGFIEEEDRSVKLIVDFANKLQFTSSDNQ
jgi:pimeloyl-ACP methyl ester carboxylesterase